MYRRQQPSDLTISIARPEAEAALRALIPHSARALSAGFYPTEEAEAAISYVFGVDRTLIDDGTYFMATRGDALCGCGGWSKRRTLYGGDQHKDSVDPLLDPMVDAARIRAFFVAPEFARQGVGTKLMQACAQAAFDAGFRRLELMATLPGVPLYSTFGFTAVEDVVEVVGNGVPIRFVRMHRSLDTPSLLDAQLDKR